MKKLLSAILLLSLLGGCTSSQSVDEQVQTNKAKHPDPLEKVNRSIWAFNWDFLDKYLLRPATIGYTKVMPMPVRKGLYNAILNLEEPANVINNALQGKGKEAGVSVGRFIINSTVGLLGTIDVAGKTGLPRESEDFGEVLGSYGVETGPYVMLPALGPSDARSFTGDIIDNLYVPIQNGGFVLGAVRGFISAVEARAALIEQEQLIKDSIDSYVFVKDVYFQNLEFKVKDGNVEPEAVDEAFEDDLDDFLDDYDSE